MHKIRCNCGKFQAELRNMKYGTRTICYCKDCQSYAHYLKISNYLLNDLGGTEVIAVRPQQISIIFGKEELSCVSLTESGSLRWFTRCCTTPICNMSRNIRTAHIVIIHTCLDHSDINSVFGSKSLHMKRASALGTPPQNDYAYFITSALYYYFSKAWTHAIRLYRLNPFIDQVSKKPIASPVTINEMHK